MHPARSILLVEPAPGEASHWRTAARREGMRVHVVQSAEQALLFLRKHRPDAVVSELRLLGASGTRLCQQARRLGFEGPFYLLSPTPDDQIANHCLASGASVMMRGPGAPVRIMQQAFHVR